MSYDAWIEIDTGGPCPAKVWPSSSLNYTSNVNGIWSEALRAVGFQGSLGNPLLSDLDGFLAEEAFQILRSAALWLREHEVDLVKLEPRNGWGSVSGAAKFLEDLASGCALHPKAKVRLG
jgi:hypothetical protein